jgi:hypothetical protein
MRTTRTPPPHYTAAAAVFDPWRDNVLARETGEPGGEALARRLCFSMTSWEKKLLVMPFVLKIEDESPILLTLGSRYSPIGCSYAALCWSKTCG